MQSHQQANRLGRRSEVFAVALRQSGVKTLPVNPICQQVQRMIVVEQLLELRLKQIQLAGFRPWFGLHADLKLQAFDALTLHCLQF